MDDVPTMTITTVLDVVNEFGTAPREVAGEQHQPFPPLEDLVPAALIAQLRAHTVSGDDAASDPQAGGDVPELAEVCAAADALHRVFAAPDAEHAAAVLNQGLQEHAMVAQLSSDGALGWRTPSTTRLLEASMLGAVATWGAVHGLAGLHVCSAHRCVDAYADSTGRRQFCSPTCLSRAKVAAHRSRKRLGQPTQSRPTEQAGPQDRGGDRA